MAKQVRRPSDPTVAASVDGGQTVAAPVDADYTVAAALGGSETTAVPNTRPTDKVELAWSTPDVLGDEEIPEEKPQAAAVAGQSWGATLRIAGLLVAACLVLAGAIVLGRWVLTSDNPPSKAAPPQGATSAAPANSPTSAAPVSITSTKGQDDGFMQALNDKGITGLPPEQTITYGKQICQDLYRGVKRDAEVGSFRDANTPKNPYLADHADDFVNVSIKAYCPQFAP